MNKNYLVVVVLLLLAGAGLWYSMSKSTGTTYTSTTTPPIVQNNTNTNPNTNVNTNTPPTATQPIIVTNTSVSPSDTTAIVNGTVNPKGAFTSYWYEYGTGSTLGKTSARQILGSGYRAISAPAYVTGLAADTSYSFRLVAENSYGKSAGAEYSFRTTRGTPARAADAWQTSALDSKRWGGAHRAGACASARRAALVSGFGRDVAVDLIRQAGQR